MILLQPSVVFFSELDSLFDLVLPINRSMSKIVTCHLKSLSAAFIQHRIMMAYLFVTPLRNGKANDRCL